jgi:spermidine synthase
MESKRKIMTNHRTDKTGRKQTILEVATELFKTAGQSDWSNERIQATSRKTLRINLFLTSFIVLFFELACIRWVPAQVTYLGFFINFVLMAIFLGTGIGILAGKRPNLWLPPFPLVLFIFVFIVSRFDFELKILSNDVLYYGASEFVTGNQNFLILPLIFSLVTITVLPLGRSLGRLLNSLPPLEAYSIDILGSLAGIALFFVMSYFSLQPIIWFGLIALIYVLLKHPKELIISGPLLLGTLYTIWFLGLNSQWSPYYRIQAFPNDYGGLSISVNNTGHQMMTTLDNKENFYYQVYDSFAPRKFDNVMIIGAGSGMDVALALHEGAKQIDAVEIDPILYKLGKEFNPQLPYSDPRVHVVINDGRAFLRTTDKKYDLIIFALPDSLTLTSGFSNLRLESFLFTMESFQSAADKLADGGVLVLYNYYREDWFINKLAYSIQKVMGEPPYVVKYGTYGRAAVLMASRGLAKLNPTLDKPYQQGQMPISSGRGYEVAVSGSGLLDVKSAPELPTDDWPFMYMPQRILPPIFLAAIGIALAIALAMLGFVWPRKTGLRFEWHFFALGVAFMLLETRSLVTFSLLFGSTWIVNSLVFFAILLSVLLAILVNAKRPIRNPNLLYAGLASSLILNYVVPLNSLLGIENVVLRYILAGSLTFLPAFLANIVFSHSFKDSDHSDMAFGANLIGAFVGGLLEYSALVIGYQALLLIALTAYVVAFLFSARQNNRATN